jgi:3-isopropylmalate/(R)-2-methylmalate dehydratase small subunit
VCGKREDIEQLGVAIAANPAEAVTIDLNGLQVTCGAVTIPVTMPEGARQSLTSGQWDFLGQLLDGEAAIQSTAEKVPYMRHFATN